MVRREAHDGMAWNGKSEAKWGDMLMQKVVRWGVSEPRWSEEAVHGGGRSLSDPSLSRLSEQALC